jgi:DNA-binding response OmpR family regulator
MIKRLLAKTVLLVEDEALIAIDVADMLENAGFEVVGMMSSCEEAEAWLENNTPDVAVIDPKLRDGYCEGVAKVLASRRVPFVVLSGEPPRTRGSHSTFLKGEWLMKPTEPSRLLSAIRISVAMQDRRLAGQSL